MMIQSHLTRYNCANKKSQKGKLQSKIDLLYDMSVYIYKYIHIINMHINEIEITTGHTKCFSSFK